MNYAPSLHIKNVPVKLVSMTAFHPFNEISAAGDKNCPPPLLTTKSNFPYVAIVVDIRFLCKKKDLPMMSRRQEKNNTMKGDSFTQFSLLYC